MIEALNIVYLWFPVHLMELLDLWMKSQGKTRPGSFIILCRFYFRCILFSPPPAPLNTNSWNAGFHPELTSPRVYDLCDSWNAPQTKSAGFLHNETYFWILCSKWLCVALRWPTVQRQPQTPQTAGFIPESWATTLMYNQTYSIFMVHSWPL